MGTIKQIQLTEQKNLLTDVENRRVYNLDHCELNVFETYRKSEMFKLTFNDLVITSMVRGKKVMHMPGANPFDYKPGETLIAPPGTSMYIDFPEARKTKPTQCIALTLDRDNISNTIAYLNEYYPRTTPGENWQLNFNQTHFKNSEDLAGTINTLVTVCMEKSLTKDILADLALKELLVRIVQLQYLHQLDDIDMAFERSGPFHHMAAYIRENLHNKLDVEILSKKACMSRSQFFRSFKQEFGITPVQFIIKERLKKAKLLLTHTRQTIQQVSLETGFDDVNNFIKIFKKTEGTTPGTYRTLLLGNTH